MFGKNEVKFFKPWKQLRCGLLIFSKLWKQLRCGVLYFSKPWENNIDLLDLNVTRHSKRAELAIE